MKRETPRPSMTTQVLSLITARKNGVASVAEVRRARVVLRFGGLFAATILVPALLLAALALNTISSEELFLESEYRSRATAMTEEVSQELVLIQQRFREAVASRLALGESPLERLGDLSPYLRGAYRFDQSGALAAPFAMDDSRTMPKPTRSYRDARRIALQHEVAGRWTDAAASWQNAIPLARDPVFEAEARLGEARSRARTGDGLVAQELLSALYSDYANVRDSRGFRVGDLALLLRAEMRFAQTKDPADSGLMEVVERTLGETWTIGYLGEAKVADTALSRLAGVANPDWVTGRRADLNERVAQLAWAEQVRNELDLAAEGARPKDIRFLGARFDSPSVWANVDTDQGTYAFSFSREGIVAHLLTTLERMNDREELLVAELLMDGQPFPEGAIKVAPLENPLGSLRVAVSWAEPAAFASIARRRRLTRIAIVVVSVFLVGVGVWFSARTISQELENARMKADFAANVSHELRSPITQIRLKGEALQFGLTAPGEDTQQHYDAIVREAERLSRLVDNVLDFAAIERGAKRYQLRMDDLASVVFVTVEANRHAIESRGLEIEVELPDDLPPVWIDREAVGQILVNLLSNAAKYGENGGWVGVSVRRGPHGVEVAVADRGIGISQTDLDHIFDHFYRSSDSSVRRQKGTGIGLTIVRYIIEAHGGTIAVESALGQGTTFTVTFPYEPPTGAGVAT